MRTSSTESTASPSWRGLRPSWRSTPHTGDPLVTLLAPPQALPAPIAEPAAVHREGVAVDVAALLRVGQERDGSRHVLRGGEAAHGGATLYILVGVAASRLVLDVHLGHGLQKYLNLGSRSCLPRAEYSSDKLSCR